MPLEGYLFIFLWICCIVFGVCDSINRMNKNTKHNKISLIKYLIGDE